MIFLTFGGTFIIHKDNIIGYFNNKLLGDKPFKDVFLRLFGVM